MDYKKRHRHAIYVKPELWQKAEEDAKRAGQSMSEYIRDAITQRLQWRVNSVVPCPHCNTINPIEAVTTCWMCGQNLTKKKADSLF